ncbi:MAG: hypothetical protein BAJALOKI1v1_540014 [Promethearchaeota archaeon]|nr:MAG: hypothetical protein BAJALOKI1v1_540014 [Candidatus Lokiarchaeota archaeon]
MQKKTKEQDSEIEKLTTILSSLQELYYKKKEQLKDLEEEIEELKSTLNNLNSLISSKSFSSANELYKQSAQTNPPYSASTSAPQEEDYFIKDIPQEKLTGTKIKRKIFLQKSNGKEELICILNLIDMDKLEIKILSPDKYNIKETSEIFIKAFLKGALIKIKEQNPDLELAYKYYKSSDIIEEILIKNLKSIDAYDLITEKVRELFQT